MAYYHSGKQITGIYHGTKEITKKYHGSKLVWEKFSARLPKEYQEVECIESVGTAWLKFDYTSNINDVIYVDFEFTKNQEKNSILGCELGYDIKADIKSSRIGYQRIANSTVNAWYAGVYHKRTYQGDKGIVVNFKNLDSPKNNMKYCVKMSSKSIDVNDKTYDLDSAEATGRTQNEVYVFYDNFYAKEEYNHITYGKIYSLTIWREGSTIRNLVPCYRKSDHKSGMYDTITNTFFTSETSTDFLVGADVKCKKLEYILASGNQYINLHLIPNVQHSFSTKFEITNKSVANNMIIGSRTDGTFQTSNAQIYMNWQKVDKKVVLRNRYNSNDVQFMENVDGYFELDKAKNQNCQLENPNQPYFLFALNKLGTPDAFANCKLRFFKIYENENLKMDLIPCKIGNRIGLLDNVTKVFFTGEIPGKNFAGQ